MILNISVVEKHQSSKDPVVDYSMNVCLKVNCDG